MKIRVQTTVVNGSTSVAPNNTRCIQSNKLVKSVQYFVKRVISR